jgi:hypothetical protein
MLASEESLNSIATSLASIDAKMPAWSMALSTALASKLIVKATSGKLRSASGRLDTSAPNGTYYLQLWNLADVPADTTAVSTTNVKMAPQKIIHVQGVDDFFQFDFGDAGISASVGLTFGLSSTEFTQTAAGAYLSLTAEYA